MEGEGSFDAQAEACSEPRAEDCRLPATAADGGSLRTAATGLMSRLSWLGERLPEMMPLMAEYTTPQFLEGLVGALREEGLLENTVDALDAIQAAVMAVISIRAADLMGSQLARLQKQKELLGTVDGKVAFAINRLMDTLTRAMKASVELKEAAGFSKQSRRRLGDRPADALQKILDEVSREAGIEEREDVTMFSLGKLIKPTEADDVQFVMVENEMDRPLSEEEERELVS